MNAQSIFDTNLEMQAKQSCLPGNKNKTGKIKTMAMLNVTFNMYGICWVSSLMKFPLKDIKLPPYTAMSVGARKRGWSRNKSWLGAMYVFLLVYLPVFWDWIPTVVVHKYYCETEAGFWVYKTVDDRWLIYIISGSVPSCVPVLNSDVLGTSWEMAT